MKRFLFLFLILVFSFSLDVSATSSTETTTESSDNTSSSSGMNSDKTWVKEGHFQASYTYRFFNTSNNLYGNYSQLEFAEISVEEGYVYIVFKEEPFVNSSQIENTHWGYYLCGKGVATVKYILKNQNVDGTYNERTLTDTITLNSNDDTGGYSLFSVIWEEEDVGKMEDLQLDYNTKPIIDSDIPIFDIDDVEGYHKYEESGDWSSAQNAPDYTDEYDDTIPLPHNLQVLSGTDQLLLPGGADSVLAISYPATFTKDIVLSWNQTDALDNMSYCIESSISTIYFKEINGELSEKTFVSSTGYLNIQENVAYNGRKSVTVTIPYSQLNTLKIKGFLYKMNIRVRNKVGSKTSKWVNITIDFKNKKATATEEGYDDNSETGGDEYNDSDVGETPAIRFDDLDTDNISINGLLSFVKGGFGLLGDTGIIALMSKTFLYLPSTVWTIIYFFLSMMVIISIIKLIKGVFS